MKTLLLNKILIILVAIGSIAWDFEPASLARSTSLQPAPPLQEEMVVARVFFADQADLNRLVRELDVWEVHHREGYLVALLPADQYARLQQTGYRVEMDQTQTALVGQPLPLAPVRAAGIPGYSCYRTITETYASLSQLTTTYPNLASWVDIGDSWDKITSGGPEGDDLFALILTNKSKPGPKSQFFLMAEIHARELTTAELATRFAERLVANYGLDPDITWLLDYNEIHIVPMTNPDGRRWAEEGRLWRKNTDNSLCTTFPNYGIDLNRNSSFGWGGASSSPCDIEYQGPSAASEPETQAIQNYVKSILPDQRGSGAGDAAPITTTGVFISLHSYGPIVLFPYWYLTTPTPNDAQLQTLGRKFGYFNGYPVCQAGESGCEYPATGTTDDWAYGDLGVAAYTFEVGTAFFESCATFENTVLPENLPALLYAFKAARRPYQSPLGPDSITVTVALTSVIAGTPVTLTAMADDTRYDSNGWGTELTQTIAAARYTVDAPSWITGIVSYSMAPSDGAWSSPTETVRAVVNTAGWLPGRHLLLVESQDASSNWGVPGAVFLRIAEQYGVAWTPAVATGQAHPGQTVRYTLQLTNTGNVSDTFDLVAGGNTWTTTMPSSVGPVMPGSSTELTVTVNIPATAVGGATDTAIVTATSRADHARSATATLTTTASFHALSVMPAASMQSADPGAQVTYTLWVTNTGNVSDTFNLSVAGNAWTTIASPVGPLAAGVGVSQSVKVSVPTTALAGATDTARITLTSQGDPTQSSTSVLTTTANAIYGLTVKPSAMMQSAKPGAQVMYTLRVTNTGNIADAFDVSIAGNAWTTIVVSQVGPLSPGNGADLGVSVSIPVTAPSGAMDAVRVTLTSQANHSKSFTPVLTTTCNIVRGLALEPSVMTWSGAPGTSVTYMLHLTNTGDVTDTFALHNVGNTWDVQLWPAIGITLTPNVGSDVMVHVTIPLTATGRLSDTVRVEVTGVGVSRVSVLTTQAIFQIYLPFVTNDYSAASQLQLKARLQRR